MKLRIKLALTAMAGAFIRKLLGPNVGALVVRSEYGLFAVDPEDMGVGQLLRKHGTYAREEIERIKPHLTPSSRVLIVGSHVGTLAIPLARFCRELVAIEANPHTYDLLVMNVALNGVTNCRTIHIAASDKQENIEFLLSRANSGGSKRAPKIRSGLYDYDKPEKISVPAVRLDDLLGNSGFDAVIMDIEGSEYFALKGMPGILSRCKFLVVEFVPHHLKNVSGATVSDFLSVIQPYFSRLTIPSLGLQVRAADFASTLQGMYDREQYDDGMLFEKD